MPCSVLRATLGDGAVLAGDVVRFVDGREEVVMEVSDCASLLQPFARAAA
ncbi:MAG: hypothetical protein HC927_10555 [Deltaproteobacteria bacterium]|nr:hypothetical protein [Deltaproteobacteria bacterium]